MDRFVTFFKREIFAEVAVPTKQSTKVVIICSGAPSVPSKKTLMEFLVKKGYWAIHIRYRGTWESKGVFLEKSLDQDLIDVIDELPHGFADLWSGKKYKIKPAQIIVMGSSFGGPAAILASQDLRISKAIALCPVVKWKAPSPDEPLPKFKKYLEEAYGQVYRTKLWDKLGKDGFYEPTGTEDGSKIMIIHASDDRIVRIQEVAEFAKKSKATFIKLRRGGHLSSNMVMEPKLWKTISKFLRTTRTTSRKSS